MTLPEPRVDNGPPDLDPDLLERAARLALSSHHPLAVALAREARDRMPYEDAVEEPGQGVRAIIEGQRPVSAARVLWCRNARWPAASRARR